MNQTIKICQNCNQSFTIDSEDFTFYERINVPSPTFCPDCRLIRRLMWRNERTLHYGVCAATGKKVITMFSPEAGIVMYDRDYWWSDNWDPLEYGKEYDFHKPFFVQFQELLKRVPLPNLASSSNVNSPYVNHSQECKESYLVFASHHAENIFYSMGVLDCEDSMDLHTASRVREGYDDTLVTGLSRVRFSYAAEESMDSDFLYHSKNMSESLGCVNMRNGKYCIFNQLYLKEEYERERSKYDFGSYKELQTFEKKFTEFHKLFPRRYATLIKCVNVTGENCITSKNCKNCFDLYGEMENSKFSIHGLQMRDGYDMYGFGVNAELMYEGVDVGINAMRCIGTILTHGCQNATYTYNCYNASNIFGCVGLRKKEYCILNKEYSKEAYETILPKIIEHMNEAPYTDSQGRVHRYGEFFPGELSPFAYNETIAQEYFPLTKDNAAQNGYKWKEAENKEYEITLRSETLPDHIKDVEDAIVQEVIGCAHEGRCTHQCATAFKIIPQELEFYRKYRIALPRLCPNCRHYGRLAKRTPFKLWKRKCQCAGTYSERMLYRNAGKHEHGMAPCNKEFETAYSPDRSETVYCEQCYLSEVK